jgi:hypothetical protein
VFSVHEAGAYPGMKLAVKWTRGWNRNTVYQNWENIMGEWAYWSMCWGCKWRWAGGLGWVYTQIPTLTCLQNWNGKHYLGFSFWLLHSLQELHKNCFYLAGGDFSDLVLKDCCCAWVGRDEAACTDGLWAGGVLKATACWPFMFCAFTDESAA